MQRKCCIVCEALHIAHRPRRQGGVKSPVHKNVSRSRSRSPSPRRSRSPPPPPSSPRKFKRLIRPSERSPSSERRRRSSSHSDSSSSEDDDDDLPLAKRFATSKQKATQKLTAVYQPPERAAAKKAVASLTTAAAPAATAAPLASPSLNLYHLTLPKLRAEWNRFVARVEGEMAETALETWNASQGRAKSSTWLPLPANESRVVHKQIRRWHETRPFPSVSKHWTDADAALGVLEMVAPLYKQSYVLKPRHWRTEQERKEEKRVKAEKRTLKARLGQTKKKMTIKQEEAEEDRLRIIEKAQLWQAEKKRLEHKKQKKKQQSSNQ